MAKQAPKDEVDPASLGSSITPLFLEEALTDSCRG